MREDVSRKPMRVQIFLIAESEVQDELIVTCFPELNPDISIIIGVPTAEIPLGCSYFSHG